MKVFIVFTLFIFYVYSSRINYYGAALEDTDNTWKILHSVDDNEPITFRLALYQQNLDILNDIFTRVSDPKSPDFHQYLTRDEVMDLVSPPEFKVKKVLFWLNENNCDSESFGDYIETTCLAGNIKDMLEIEDISYVMDLFSGEISPKIVSGEYSLPEHIGDVVQFIQNLASVIHKRRIRSHMNNQRYDPASEDEVIPLTLFNLYNISHVISSDSSQNVAEFSKNGYLASDLSSYETGVGLPPANPITQVGSFVSSPPNVECTLDIQLITSVGQNGTNYYYTIDGWILDFAQALLATSNPPLVNSVSWSANERTEGQVYITRTNTDFQKLGTMGVSILAASGDDGAVGTTRCSGNRFYFNPGYPATSPYVTSVGATMIVTNPPPVSSTTAAPVCGEIGIRCTTNGTEHPADENLGGYATGGGFSVYQTQPDYQSTVVSEYLSDDSIPKPPSSYYDPSNRGFPDVAANGYNVLIYRGGRWEPVGGTSASTPIWGGIFALINDVLITNGKQPLGFANPFLYQLFADVPGAFTNIGDLTTNNDDGCEYGYTSNPNGWDPVTGLGTPNVGIILSYVEANINMFP